MVLCRSPSTCHPYSAFQIFDEDFLALDKLFDQLEFNSSPSKSPRVEQPAYTYTSDDDGATFEVDLPGVDRHDIVVENKDNKLTVTGKRFNLKVSNTSDEQMDDANDHSEGVKNNANDPVPSVTYKLEMRLGSKVDVDAIEAHSPGNGVLHVTLPFRKPQVHSIAIRS